MSLDKGQLLSEIKVLLDTQDTKEFQAILRRSENKLKSLSIRDIADSNRVPLVRNDATFDKQLRLLGASCSSTNFGSSSPPFEQVASSSSSRLPPIAQRSTVQRLTTSLSGCVLSDGFYCYPVVEFPFKYDSIDNGLGILERCDFDKERAPKILKALTECKEDRSLRKQASSAVANIALPSSDPVSSKKTVKGKKKEDVQDLPISKKKKEPEENKLSLALEYMRAAKEVLDPSRSLYEAAMLFHEMNAMERAVYCYQVRRPETVLHSTSI